ncbi:MAG: cystathionine gamma-synthase [Deltaproteobacteria bacterium]|nr:cystathionine gamma-synthase [Deltaproteobacteria bacterium]
MRWNVTENKKNSQRLNTRSVHAGFSGDPGTGALNPPVFLTSTYAQESPGVHTGFVYARTRNPTRDALEAAMAELEGGTDGIAYGSGSAATASIIQLLDAGDHVVSFDDVYGGTRRVFEKVFARQGLSFSFTDLTVPGAFEAACRPESRLLWIESPTNPMLKMADIADLSRRAHARNMWVVVDNTFLSPYLQNPLALGADLVVHSTTKYLNGHSDTVGGAVVTSVPELAESLRFLQNSVGSIPGPMDCYLCHRGIKTLAVRMERHCSNALEIARFLETHPRIQRTRYPFLKSHPQHQLALTQTRGGGGIVTFEMNGNLENARRFLESVRIFALAESLGGVESLIEHPAIMTHASVPQKVREELGLSDTLVRLSVGIEDVEDLKEDLAQALEAAY